MGNGRTIGARRRPFGTSIIVGFLSSVLLIATMIAVANAGAAERSGAPLSLRLVMIEEEGCNYCIRWHRDVGPGYPLSEEGRRAPLVQVDRFSPEAKRFQRVTFTPTFILMSSEGEVGRITGYPGADFFWSMLADLLAKTGASKAPFQRDTAVR